ncbi:MAG: biosynthetic peptidoglycan transglycosylase [Polyangiales bacterium]
MTTKQKWYIGAAVALGLLCSIFYFVAMRAAEKRAIAKIEAKTGLHVDIGFVVTGLRGIQFRNLELSSDDGGVSFQIDDLEVRGAPWRLASESIRASRKLLIDDATIEIDVSKPSATKFVRSMRSDSSGAPSDRKNDESTALPEIVASSVNVHLKDAIGSLARFTIRNARLNESEANADIEAMFIGDPKVGDHVDMADVEVLAVRGEETRLKSLSIAKGDARWVDAIDVQRDSAQTHPRTPLLLPRLQSAASVLRARSRIDDDSDATPLSAGARVHASGLSSRLTPDATIVAEALSIESKAPDGSVQTLNPLSFRVEGDGKGGFQFKGDGKTKGDAFASWDLNIDSASLRAEGALRFDKIPVSLVAPLLPFVPWYHPAESQLSGSLQLDPAPNNAIQVRGQLTLKDASFFHERIAPNPIRHVNASITGEGYWQPSERSLQIRKANLRLNDVNASVQGTLEKTEEHYRIDLQAAVPVASCQDVIEAIPADLLGDASGFLLTGTWSASGELRIDSRDFDATVFEIAADDNCSFVRGPEIASLARFEQPFVHRVVESDDSTFEMTTGPGTANWVSIGQVSPFIVQAVISHEDGAFYRHHGFAPWAMRDALVRNLKAGRFVLGASTISMQLTKNLFLYRDKTLSRKAKEIVLTWWLEKRLSKDKILELYLNVIEYGPKLYGVRPAMMRYFGRSPIDASPCGSGIFGDASSFAERVLSDVRARRAQCEHGGENAPPPQLHGETRTHWRFGPCVRRR